MINGTHIPIKAPNDNSSSYITRKKEFAITLQAVCDARLIFRNCFVGFAGSVHDKRIFTRSYLWSEIHRNQEKYFPHNQYIIGDKAYPVLQWCIPPYIDRGNLTIQISFNKNVSKMRQIIERAFALLKGADENNRDFIEEGANVEVVENIEINIGDARNNPAGLAKRDYLCHLIA
ncbi:putative nuclease HARBI1 isoform X2 [Harpegnathos saltator]|uniref:putative nuclease HARBI1 isoform X2 n=1 Tax=Harpegnathos saltator TaxID=610380 RepID=UPI000DBEE092|nr:putative nuclease HARBI1 isoform X2 [Harpegnathos saltator]